LVDVKRAGFAAGFGGGEIDSKPVDCRLFVNSISVQCSRVHKKSLISKLLVHKETAKRMTRAMYAKSLLIGVSSLINAHERKVHFTRSLQ
jgi:hypothetical protein